MTAVLPLSFLPSHRAESLTHVEHVPPRAGSTAAWPSWAPPSLRTAFEARGVALPWTHQATAAGLAWSGTHTVVATGTGSGKSLAYQLPALAALLRDAKATVLYISPTKALAADQLRSLRALDLPDTRPATFDGDTSREERDWVRQHARVVLTNPDMLHHGILPNHASWTRFLRGLRFVVVDECHTYRGVFGSHVAHVLRRLRRVAARYTPRTLPPPCFILASATSGDPQATGSRLTGLPMTAVTTDASPRGGVTFALWEPPLLPPVPDFSSIGEADLLLADESTLMTAVAERAAPAVAPTSVPATTTTTRAPTPPRAATTTASPTTTAGATTTARNSTTPGSSTTPTGSTTTDGSANARTATTACASTTTPRATAAASPTTAATVHSSTTATGSTTTAGAATAASPTTTALSSATARGSTAGGSTATADSRTPGGSANAAGGSANAAGGSANAAAGAARDLAGAWRDAEPVRRSALRETADLLTEAVIAGVRTLAFVRSRKGAEVVASMARRSLDQAVPGLGERVAAYRAGYLREERRALERDLMDGTLLGLASTNALELGVDLVGLDAVLISGYPGTLASLWQQAGRAGRAGRDALCVLVARDDPLDTYLVHHPEALFGKPVEATVLDPGNPHVLAPQLCCAAAELPLTPADLPLFGPTAEATLDALVAAGILRKRPSGWYWTERQRPDVDLRGAGGGPIAVVEEATGRLLGTVDTGSAHHQVHTGAVHLHQGVSYVVDKLDLADSVALVHAEEPDWSTHPRDVTSLTVLSVRQTRTAGPVTLSLGEVEVTSQVVSYQRRRISSGEVIDTCQLDLPERILKTVAVWWTVSPEALDEAGIAEVDWPGALHAAEHASIGLLPLVATCDRWDIGGLSTALHADTGLPTVFVYDGHPGGAGFAERAFDVAADWLGATRAVVAECRCEQGCPSCVQSPKCGNGNNPLNKHDAVQVLSLVLAAL
ncbi:DEAD/DEAH box helicase [Dactylosporangium sp. NPDC000521]|uniref:DEAD/DEAH box helicase n=1 Tax=Dactylosporangium sp. NPDC000521 TaxID=3363975 RepID=UPI0036A20DFE